MAAGAQDTLKHLRAWQNPSLPAPGALLLILLALVANQLTQWQTPVSTCLHKIPQATHNFSSPVEPSAQPVPPHSATGSRSSTPHCTKSISSAPHAGSCTCTPRRARHADRKQVLPSRGWGHPGVPEQPAAWHCRRGEERRSPAKHNRSRCGGLIPPSPPQTHWHWGQPATQTNTGRVEIFGVFFHPSPYFKDNYGRES